MTVGRLIEDLEGFDMEAEVRLAFQPSWPFEHSVGRVEEVYPEGSDGTPVVYLAEDGQLGYLPGEVSEVLGWR